MKENNGERKLDKDQETKCDSSSRRNMTGELRYSAAVGGVRQNGMTLQ